MIYHISPSIKIPHPKKNFFIIYSEGNKAYEMLSFNNIKKDTIISGAYELLQVVPLHIKSLNRFPLTMMSLVIHALVTTKRGDFGSTFDVKLHHIIHKQVYYIFFMLKSK